MSQKSNLLTIRFPNKSLNLDIKNPTKFLKTYKTLTHLKQSLERKGIILNHYIIKEEDTNCFIKLKIFFGTQKLLKYKTLLKNKRLNTLKKDFIKNLIQNISNYKTTVSDIIILNHYLDNKQTKTYFNEFKKFKNILFSRQFSLFIDFIKLTTLFTNKKISTEIYLNILGKIFKILPKNKHARYFFFIDQLLKIIVEDQYNSIQGVKLQINGKLKGKLRSSSEQISQGNLSTSSISKSINYSQVHIYTIYGSFGIKI